MTPKFGVKRIYFTTSAARSTFSGILRPQGAVVRDTATGVAMRVRASQSSRRVDFQETSNAAEYDVDPTAIHERFRTTRGPAMFSSVSLNSDDDTFDPRASSSSRASVHGTPGPIPIVRDPFLEERTDEEEESEKCGSVGRSICPKQQEDDASTEADGREDRAEQDRSHEPSDERPEDRAEEDRVEEDRAEEDRVEEDRVEEDRVEEDRVEEDRVEEDRVAERSHEPSDPSDGRDEDRVEEDRLPAARLEEARLPETRSHESQEARPEEARLPDARVEERSHVPSDPSDESHEARLEEARLEEARLEEARLEEARLEEARLEEARLEEALLPEARRDESHESQEARLTEARSHESQEARREESHESQEARREESHESHDERVEDPRERELDEVVQRLGERLCALMRAVCKRDAYERLLVSLAQCGTKERVIEVMYRHLYDLASTNQGARAYRALTRLRTQSAVCVPPV